MSSELLLRRMIVLIGRLLYARRLVTATDGNISARMNRRFFLITPSGFSKGFLKEDDIVKLSLEQEDSDQSGQTLRRRQIPEFKPSAETPLHRGIYRVRDDVGAVIHTHPPFATGFAVSGRKLDAQILPETYRLDGAVARVRYYPAGSLHLAEAVKRVIDRHNSCLLLKHGALVVGLDLLEAYHRLERLELLAQVAYLAQRTS